MEFLEELGVKGIFSIATAVLSIATVITSVTKSTADNKVVNFLLKFLNVLAGNVGKNKNADDK